jgi:plastocyanin
MIARLVSMAFLAACFVAACQTEAQEKKKRTGTVTGEVKSSMPTPNKINQFIEVLADGEEKERKYRVVYDKEVKGPNKKVLEAVKAAKVGDRVRLEWVEGEGYNITAFEVLKKKKDSDDKKDK